MLDYSLFCFVSVSRVRLFILSCTKHLYPRPLSRCGSHSSTLLSCYLLLAVRQDHVAVKHVREIGISEHAQRLNLLFAAVTTPLTPAGTGQDSCEGFRNVVINTAASTNPGFPFNTWKNLAANGVEGWSTPNFFLSQREYELTFSTCLGGFSFGNLSTTPTYDWPPGKPVAEDDEMNNHQYRVVMDGKDVAAAIDMLIHHPPTYLELYNEPDLSFEGYTTLTSPEQAWAELKPLFDIRPNGTTFIAPSAVSHDWLQRFHTACTNATYSCFQDLPILSPHIYNFDPDAVIQAVKSWKALFTTTKEIWIGELSPAAPGCPFNQQGVIDYMNKIVSKIFDPSQDVGYVKKIFWNCGEHGGNPDPNAAGSCNPSLTDENGNANPILMNYHTVCDNIPILPSPDIIS